MSDILNQALVYGKRPDGTPYHPDNGTVTTRAATPTSAGVALANVACKFIVLRNRSGININYAASGGAQVPLYNGQDERIPVSNANQIRLYDADDSGASVGYYTVV